MMSYSDIKMAKVYYLELVLEPIKMIKPTC